MIGTEITCTQTVYRLLCISVQASFWLGYVFTLQLPNRKFIHSYGYLPIASVRLLLVSVTLKASRLCCVNTSSLEQQKNIPSGLLVTLKPDGLCPFAAPVATTTVLLIALISSGSPLDAASTQTRSWGENQLVLFGPGAKCFCSRPRLWILYSSKKTKYMKKKQKHNLYG